MSRRRHWDGNQYKVYTALCTLVLQCDIAMLTVEEDEFWSGVEALEIAPEVPAQQESVSVVGVSDATWR